MWKSYAGITAQAGGGTSRPAPAPAAAAGPGGWHPSTLYMLGLIVAEIIVVGVLSRHLLR